MVKVCPVCGKKFITTNAVKFCSNRCRIEKQSKGPKKYKEPYGTLCWTCQNATGGCDWSRALKPVEGWKVKIIKIKASEGKEFVRYTDSYIVKKCPKYIKDS